MTPAIDKDNIEQTKPNYVAPKLIQLDVDATAGPSGDGGGPGTTDNSSLALGLDGGS